MNLPAIVFTKKILNENATQVLFCVEENMLPQFNLAKISPNEIAKVNSLLRHDKFDWYVNKEKPICFIFEKENKGEGALPSIINLIENESKVTWLTFPQAIKQLKNGTHRNLIQLAVQYISYGMIDDSVIAADYDEEWVKNLPPSK